MAVFSEIKKLELEGAKRIDAEYYQPTHLEISDRLSKFKTARLGDIAYVTDGEHGSPIFDDQSDIRYYSAQHVRDGFIDGAEAKTISKIIDDRNTRSRLQVGDILLSTVGTIGFSGLVTDDLLPANIDRHVARIFLNKNTLDPEFLVAFLNSKYGRSQSIRQATGNVQLNLFIDKIKEFDVPAQTDLSISSIVKNALVQRERSFELYRQAEELLIRELNLKKSDFEDELSYIVDFLETEARIDAEFYKPKYVKLLSKLSDYGSTKLSCEFDIIKSKSFDYSEEQEIGVVKTKQLGSQFINFDVESHALMDTVKKEKLPLIKNSDVLFASMGVGSLGKTNIFYDFETEKTLTVDSTLRIFRAKATTKILPEVLSVYLNSKVGQELIYKYIIGTSGIISIYNQYLADFLIPILPEKAQKEMGDLVRQSHEARQKSKQLLEDAKHQVEQLIEDA